MKFRTEIEITSLGVKIGYENRVLALGSCFAAHIARKLAGAKFRVTENPSGILFNPLSIAAAIRSYVDPAPVTRGELGFDGEVWHHFGFHGDFSAPTADEALQKMNAARQTGADALRTADRIVLTFGTAWVYERQGEAVANCHRRPAAEFSRRRLSVEEIVETFAELIEGPLAGKQIILTVSPVRHVGDTLPGNAVSKAVLRLAAEELKQRFGCVEYFPAYEIVTDATTASMPTTSCTPPRRPSRTSGRNSPGRSSPTAPGNSSRRSKPSSQRRPTAPAIRRARRTAPSAAASWNASPHSRRSIFSRKRPVSADVSK